VFCIYICFTNFVLCTWILHRILICTYDMVRTLIEHFSRLNVMAFELEIRSIIVRTSPIGSRLNGSSSVGSRICRILYVLLHCSDVFCIYICFTNFVLCTWILHRILILIPYKTLDLPDILTGRFLYISTEIPRIVLNQHRLF
jgi:hypothetical protein